MRLSSPILRTIFRIFLTAFASWCTSRCSLSSNTNWVFSFEPACKYCLRVGMNSPLLRRCCLISRVRDDWISTPLMVASWFTKRVPSTLIHTSNSEPQHPIESALMRLRMEFCDAPGASQ